MSRRPISVDHVASVIGSPADVWPHIADPARRPAWMTELKSVEATPGEVAVGDRFLGKSSILLHDFIGASEVTEVDQGRVLVEEVVIGARFVSRWELTAEGAGSTRVRHTIDVEFPTGPFSPIERWVLRRRLLRMQKASLRNLAARR
ncbi:MAG: SRPBCC family protein [Actinomycetota bacterium]|nr:SRPBCC family protein [Actinomycetota bacterium]